MSSGSPNQQSPTAIEPQPGISALLLTIGEPTTAEAHQALQNQTLPLQQISIIKNERPFSSAFNLGVSSIESEFFIQCDADMILDPNCAEVLLSRMNDQTGMVVAYLRDPLQGKVRGVKLYRTACCKKYPFENHLDCEDMFRKRLLQNHWNVEIIKNDRTLGKHAPDANDSIYQFERFKHMGAKIAARKAWFDLAYRLNQLGRAQDQQIVPLAVSAMICGFYIVKNEDLDVFVASPEYVLCRKRFTQSTSNGDFKRQQSMGIFSYVRGYWSGIFFRRHRKKLNVETVIRDCIQSADLSAWSYLLGFCSSITISSESLKENALTRFVRMLPFLRYLKRQLSYVLTMD